MGFKSKKEQETKGFSFSFEDFLFPAFLKKIRGHYGYRTRDHRRATVTPQKVFRETQARGCTFVYESTTDRYFLHYPVPVDYFPTLDRRSENQARRNVSNNATIALDPGVRKFLVGYESDGSTTVIARDAHRKLLKLLLEIDGTNDRVKERGLWRRVKNLVADLHWKTVSYLTRRYETIILGDIRVASILRSRKLRKSTKRVLNQYSFDQFKTRLTWKANLSGSKLVLVNEAYTSKTCSGCGELNDVGGSEWYKCESCGLELDRDVNSGRCMMIKALTLAN